MPRKSVKFSQKTLGRFSKKELTTIMKTNKIKMDRAMSQYSKKEIVIHLFRLQRVTQYNGLFEKLKIKPARQLTQKQKDNLASARVKLDELNLHIKQHVPQGAKIDQKSNIQQTHPEMPELDTIKGKTDNLAKKVSQTDTTEEQIINGGTVEEINSLEDLFIFSDKKLTKQKARLFERLTARKVEQGIQVGNSGKQDKQTAEIPIQTDTFEIDTEDVPEQKEEPVELPASILQEISEFSGMDDYTIEVSTLSVVDLKQVLKEVDIEVPKGAKKQELVNLVVSNKTKTNQIVTKKLKEKVERRDRKKTEKTERQQATDEVAQITQQVEEMAVTKKEEPKETTGSRVRVKGKK